MCVGAAFSAPPRESHKSPKPLGLRLLLATPSKELLVGKREAEAQARAAEAQAAQEGLTLQRSEENQVLPANPISSPPLILLRAPCVATNRRGMPA